MWIPRLIEPLLRSRVETRPVVVLTGARQTGKTSLARRLFPDYHYVSLDLPSEAAQAESEGDAFLERHPPPVIIDEVQYAPGLFRHLKRWVDRHRKQSGQFILTGSQPFVLMRGVSESLAGRAEILSLETLSFREITMARPETTVREALFKGGYPELYEQPNLDVVGFFRSYVATYLERDLRSQLQVSSLKDFERYLRSTSLRTGQLLNKAELSRDLGISASTSAQWLSVLERSGLISLLEPWFSNRNKSLVKTPKLYYTDTGLCSFLMGVGSETDLTESPYVGALWETLVYGEIRKLLSTGNDNRHLHFWRNRTQEADFLLHRAGRFQLADAKWSEHPSSKEASRLASIGHELDAPLSSRSALICRSPHRFPVTPDIEAIPLAELSAWLTQDTKERIRVVE